MKGSICIVVLLSVFISLVASSGHPFPTRPSHSRVEAKGWRLLQFGVSHSEWIHKDEIREILFNSYKKNATIANSVVRSASQKAIEILRGGHRRGRYIDVTEEYNAGIRSFILPTLKQVEESTPNYPDPNPQAHAEILDLFKQVSTDNLKQNMKDITGLRTRYYLSDYSSQSPTLLKSKVDALIKASGQSDVISDFIKNADYDQPNLRVRIPAKAGSSHADEVVILGSHLDSIVIADDTNENSRSPGADDDGSGSCTVLEVLRLVLSSKWRGSRPIHFMWFAAEEAGLLGSKTVAKKYKNDGVNVHGMLQLDMTGYMPGGPSITSLTDPNAKVAKYLGKVAKAYIPTVPLVMDSCGFACSDQWSFYRQGFPAGMYIEAEPTDPYIHTIDDTMDRLDFNGMAQFVRVSLAFITEIAR